MEHAVAVKAVADEGMPTVFLITAVDDWASGSQLFIDEVTPTLCTIVVATLNVSTGGIVKVGGCKVWDAGCRGTR